MPDTDAHSVYDIFKDFQPAGAALVALMTAVIAYAAATAKVRLDRRIAAKAAFDEKLAACLCIKYEAELAARVFRNFLEDETLSGLRARFDGTAPPHVEQGVRVSLDVLSRLTAIEAATKTLHLFPADAASRISDLRVRLMGAPATLDLTVYEDGSQITDQEFALFSAFLETGYRTAVAVNQHMESLEKNLLISRRN